MGKTTTIKPIHKSRFKSIIRIDPYQLKWLKEHKDTKTLAGFLDKIINLYKKKYGKTLR